MWTQIALRFRLTGRKQRCKPSRAPPKSVPARTTPAHTMPMQISLARVTASMNTSPSGAPSRAERVGRDDRRGVAGERSRVGREVAQQRRNESAHPAPQRQPTRNTMRFCGNHAVSTTIVTAPTTVPIMRNQDLRSEAPRCGWHTIAADVPAQYALSSSSQNATYRARQTETHSRTPNSSGGPAARAAFAKTVPQLFAALRVVA